MSSSLPDKAEEWLVLKFGGTSVSSAANWHNIAQVLRARIAAGFRPVVVHSALSGSTDRLESLLSAAVAGAHAPILEQIALAHRLLAERLSVNPNQQFEQFARELHELAERLAERRSISDAARARVMAMGELMATALGAAFLNAQGIGTIWVDAREILRAGSDTSAAYFAAKLRAARLEIWTDVPGLFSANPRAVPTARLLRELHYDEAQEIASNGAKVLHPRCILPVRQYQIPLHVYATQAPGLEGTVVTANVGATAAQVQAIAIRKGITLVSMESPGMWHQVGFLADAFQVFKQHGLSVDLVSTSETNVTVSLDPTANTLDGAALDALAAALGEICRVEILGPCASLSLLGQNIRGILHELGSAFELFQDQ